ncbi:MAG: ABC transporter ATP-binding protein [Methanocellales archaeon]
MSELIQVKNLTKKFNDFIAVNQISFSIKEGEIFGLLGPNGAGKSTTISMLCCLLKPTSGTVLIDGRDITKEELEVKKIIGVVPQEISLYPTLSAYENLKFYGTIYGLSGRTLQKRINEVLKDLGLEDRAHERLENLSGGMKRRVNIAASILHQPKILFLDEPTAGVDAQSRRDIYEMIERLNSGGLTILLTTHIMEEAERLCDRIGIMDRGRLIAVGSLEELLQLVEESDVIEISARNIDTEVIMALRGEPGVKKVSALENSITITTRHNRELLPKIVQKINSMGGKIESLHIIEPNLETVFLHLTGYKLRREYEIPRYSAQ